MTLQSLPQQIFFLCHSLVTRKTVEYFSSFTPFICRTSLIFLENNTVGYDQLGAVVHRMLGIIGLGRFSPFTGLQTDSHQAESFISHLQLFVGSLGPKL